MKHGYVPRMIRGSLIRIIVAQRFLILKAHTHKNSKTAPGNPGVISERKDGKPNKRKKIDERAQRAGK